MNNQKYYRIELSAKQIKLLIKIANVQSHLEEDENSDYISIMNRLREAHERLKVDSLIHKKIRKEYPGILAGGLSDK